MAFERRLIHLPSTNERFKVWVFVTDNDIWFKGKEIAACLGYAFSKAAILAFVQPEWRMTLDDLHRLSEQPLLVPRTWMPNTIFINKAGFFALTLNSTRAYAERFRFWLCESVLPSIVTNGEYINSNSRCARIIERQEEVIENLTNRLREANRALTATYGDIRL